MTTDITTTRFERPPAFWRWALIVMLAAGVVSGLLAMHILSAGHGDTAMTSMSAPAAQDRSPTMDEHAVAEPGCADCGSTGDHEAAMLACVLGLMVALLLAIRPGSVLCRVREPSLRFVSVSAPVPRPPWPPSLHELSISRT